MMGKLVIATVIAVLVCVTAPGAQAAELPNFSFNGFGTFGVVHSDEDRADFASNLFAPDGAGYTRAWSPEVDSVLGVQLTANLTSRLTGILQVVSEQQYDENYTPTVEWANLTFDITPDLSVRAGRMVQPSFMVSEYRKVRYATPWVRPPKEVYDMIPVTNADGIDMSYRFRFNGFTNTLRAMYGGRDADTSDGSEVSASDTIGSVHPLRDPGASSGPQRHLDAGFVPGGPAAGPGRPGGRAQCRAEPDAGIRSPAKKHIPGSPLGFHPECGPESTVPAS
jgi:opacity protein-like surface antigen